ncbi:response regulator [Phormidium sp. CLA17]|uniref:hybrid sensor histidine kinase/response regulator n=1 Tax=Leptolyngbya sp. Cla-17 TaxID=2803751 RepID=UPI001490AFBF|nr:hybrid sensor histidine kinase/response regulator [Leptolyngbya sp. Cla-17]MBM0741603.1 response regulator [Leptolyngbya sp. Cla-17]
MTLPATSITPDKPKRKLSLRSLLIIPFVLQIFAAVGLTGYISLKNGQKAVNDVASQLRHEMGDRLNLQVLNYLEKPYIAGQVIVAAAEEGQLDLSDFTKLERTLWRLVSQNTLEDVQIGLFDGTNIALDTTLNDGIVSRLSDKARLPQRRFYKLDKQGQRIALLKTQAKFDPRTRPWYQVVQESGKPAWTDKPYVSSSYQSATMALSQPIYKSDGTLLGVQKSTFRLDKIHDFLSGLKVGQTGQTFIVDQLGNLIASSTIKQPYILDLKNEELQQIPAVKSESAVIRATAQAILDRFGNFNAIAQNQQIDFMLANQRQFVQVSAIRDERGIDWLSVVVVPESDFMAQINANTRTTILLCLGALAVTTALGLLTSRWITKPILQLQKASQAISSGQLDQTVQVQGIHELESLADSFNQMAGQLKGSFIELETRVEERTAELKAAKLIADGANQAKSEFLANMSHELRTPLNGILGYAQILNRSKVLPMKERHGVEIIHQCSSHLLTLINDVLDLSKIEARKLDLAPKAIHFPSFLQGVAEICRIRADQKGINFLYDPDPQLPEGLFADEKRLRQVLLNLLGNAIKFTDTGSVALKVTVMENAEMEHHADPSTRWIKFRVEDTGVGIAPDQVDKIFQAFEQVGDRQRQAEGTGLGLAISQRIVQLMNGQIQVKSQPGVGSDFWFEVELAIATDWAQQNSLTTGKQIIGYEGQRRSILVVDDRWENRAVLVNLLEPLGFQLTEAENGQIGLEKIRQSQPDLVITDLAMPVMNGFELLKQVRGADDLQHQKIIVSSASVAQADQQMSLDVGGDDFLAKPVEVSELFKLLATHLNLEWTYEMIAERDAQSSPTTASQNSEETMIPTRAELKALLDLAQKGNLKRLREHLEQMVHSNPRYADFASEILQLAKQFRAEEIEDLLKQHLTEEADV